MAAEQVIRWTTAGTVVGVAAVAAVASCEYACALVQTMVLPVPTARLTRWRARVRRAGMPRRSGS